ncbi:thioredoxin-domain-containing protein [Neolentinus lepideus HHB14362 ss-1]|uniref:Thioredoxin-domain-containing protein n=1 Tax=Neolentinus lepideus HHB14362 ss-1 TaxID=1314782 RepID=A0A165W9W7_9AGAM|nr:thioredoxin-domain-containing protein [Neolentinus lepideus HHB14362 ss-1]
MSITHITSLSQLNGILSKSKGKLSVIDFHATWCGPCHAIAPTFEALSKQYKGVNFLKCDVDSASEVSGYYRVGAMPTFIFLKGDTKVDEVRGANRAGLESALRRHTSGSNSSSTGAFSGKGQTLGGSASKMDVKDSIATVQNLDPQVKVFIALLGAYFLFWYLS